MEGAADIKRLVWRVFLLFVTILSLWALLFSFFQPMFPATVTSQGTLTSQSHRKRKGYHHTYTTYHMQVSVSWQEGEVSRDAVVEVSDRNPLNLPEVGEKISISRNPLGKVVAFPDLQLRNMGVFLFIPAAILLVITLLADHEIEKAEREAIRSGVEQQPKEILADSELPEGITRTDRGSLVWRGRWGEDYVQEHKQLLERVCALIGLGIVLIGGMMGWIDGSPEFILIILPVGVMMPVIGFFCSWLTFRSPQFEEYKLSEGGLKVGAGRSTRFYTWQSIQAVQDCGPYLLVSGKRVHSRVYATKDQMPFLQERIRSNTDCAVHFANGEPV